MRKIKSLFGRVRKLSRKKKIAGIVGVLIILFFVMRGGAAPVKIEFVSASRGNIDSVVTASGILSGSEVSNLRFNVSGRLNYLGLKSGDSVKKGQVVARVDSTLLNASLQQAINNRRNTQAAVDSIHDQVKDHSGDETFAQKATRTAAEVANDNAYDALKSAERALQDAVLFSPIAGIYVSQDDLAVGQNISVTNNIAKIVDFSSKRFEAKVDESDIGQIKIGQKAKVILNAYGDTIFYGKVTEVASETETDSTGSITVMVKVQLDTNEIASIYGLNGQVDIITNEMQNVITIPQDALISDNEVYVQNLEGVVEKRKIETGIRSDTEIEVTSGIAEGEKVVTNPQAVAQ